MYYYIVLLASSRHLLSMRSAAGVYDVLDVLALTRITGNCSWYPFLKFRNALESSRRQLSHAFRTLENGCQQRKLRAILPRGTTCNAHNNTGVATLTVAPRIHFSSEKKRWKAVPWTSLMILPRGTTCNAHNNTGVATLHRSLSWMPPLLCHHGATCHHVPSTDLL